MQKNGIWIPLLASVGVGAATFFTMTRNNEDIGQAIQKVVPFVSQLNSGTSSSPSQ